MIYKLVFNYSVSGQRCENAFNYSTSAPGSVFGGAADLGAAFVSTVGPAFEGFWTVAAGGASSPGISVVAIYDPTDFYDDAALTLSPANATGGEVIAPIVACVFRSPRYAVNQNRAFKHVAGFGENQVQGFNFQGTTEGDILATAMSTVLTTGITSYYPTLLYRQKIAGYPLYPDEATQRANSQQGITYVLRPRISTQRSRAWGVGV